MQSKFKNPYGNPDKNQGPIVALMRRMGAMVAITTGVGRGFPDVVTAFERRFGMAELKAGDGELRQSQELFRNEWHNVAGVDIPVLRTGQQAVRYLLRAPEPTTPIFGKPRLRRVILEYEDGHREIVLPNGEDERLYAPGPEDEPGTARSRVGRDHATER